MYMMMLLDGFPTTSCRTIGFEWDTGCELMRVVLGVAADNFTGCFIVDSHLQIAALLDRDLANYLCFDGIKWNAKEYMGYSGRVRGMKLIMLDMIRDVTMFRKGRIPYN